MTEQDELAVLRVAYANCVNDLKRTKAHLKQAEDMLLMAAALLRDKAETFRLVREDNPGTSYVGKG